MVREGILKTTSPNPNPHPKSNPNPDDNPDPGFFLTLTTPGAGVAWQAHH